MTGGRVLKVPKELAVELSKITKWKHCMSYDSSYFGEPAGEIKRAAYQIERLTTGIPVPDDDTDVSPGGVPVTEANANQTLKFPEAQKGTIGRLVEVVEKLRDIKQHNEVMQAQFAVGSPSWLLCELIEHRLHDVFVLLGE